MDITIEKQENTTILALTGRLDTSNYMQLENKLLDEIKPGSLVLIDCAGLDYISSSGLRVLLLALKKTEKTGSKLALCSLQTGIMEIFRISAFDSIFSIFKNKHDALQNFMNS